MRSGSGRRTCSRPAPLGRAADPGRRDARRSTPSISLPRRWTLPLKFLIPGTVFLVAFQIVPVIYTIEIAFSNYSTGHMIDKAAAIEAIKINSLQPPENGKQYEVAPARDSSGKLVLLLRDDASAPSSRDEEGPDAAREERRHDLARHLATDRRQGLHADQGRRALRARQGARAPQRPDAAATRRSRRRASRRRSSCSRRCATTPRRTSSCGSATAPSSTTTAAARSSTGKDELEPGWKTYIGFHNFGRLVNDPLYREPVPEDLRLDVRLRDDHGLRLVRARPLPRDHARQEGAALPALLPHGADHAVGDAGLPEPARLGGPVERRLRDHQPALRHPRAVALRRPNWAKVSVDHRERLADDAVLLPRLARRAAVDPERADRGRRVDGGGAWQVFRGSRCHCCSSPSRR